LLEAKLLPHAFFRKWLQATDDRPLKYPMDAGFEAVLSVDLTVVSAEL